MCGERSVRLPVTLGLLVVAMALLLTTACRPSAGGAGAGDGFATQAGTAIVIFIDFSGSVRAEDRASFQREIESQILPSLSPGDRLLIAPIHDKTLTEFRPLVDATLPPRPPFNGWMDNVLKYNRLVKEVEAEVAHIKEKIKADVTHVFARRYQTLYTDVFSSLLIAAKVFDNEPRRKVLVLMTDMIEDNPPYRFEDIKWSPALIDRMLGELDAKGLVPRLTNICIYVSGASAHSAPVAEDIARFWHAYFRRAGADMELSRYAHVLLHWPPSKSCRPTRHRTI